MMGTIGKRLSCDSSAATSSPMNSPSSRLRDSEYLIRVFVRLRASGTDLASANRICEIVRLNSQYTLPLAMPIQLDEEVKKRNMTRMYVSLVKVHEELVLESARQIEAMRVRVMHAPDEGFVYYDMESGEPISYPEYERRYFQHCALVKAAAELLVAEKQAAEEQLSRSPFQSPRSHNDFSRQLSGRKF